MQFIWDVSKTVVVLEPKNKRRDTDQNHKFLKLTTQIAGTCKHAPQTNTYVYTYITVSEQTRVRIIQCRINPRLQKYPLPFERVVGRIYIERPWWGFYRKLSKLNAGDGHRRELFKILFNGNQIGSIICRDISRSGQI